ncbi:MAG: hypothetical protein V3W37_05835 [Candidatus Binatia bacterium]
MAHGAETFLWGLAKFAAAGWASFVSWGAVQSWINRAKTKAVFVELNQVREDMREDRQDMKDTVKALVEAHQKSMLEVRTQINQMVQGGR